MRRAGLFPACIYGFAGPPKEPLGTESLVPGTAPTVPVEGSGLVASVVTGSLARPSCTVTRSPTLYSVKALGGKEMPTQRRIVFSVLPAGAIVLIVRRGH